jgi:predicted phosphodiesterase
MRVTRVAAIGDIHTEDATLARVLAFLADQRPDSIDAIDAVDSIDAIVAVGDIVDGPGDPDRCCELLIRHGVSCVRGNHDRWFREDRFHDLPDKTRRDQLSPRHRRFIDELPATRSFDTPGGKLLVCHGVGADDMNFLRPDDHGYALDSNVELQALIANGEYRYMLGGHTHRHMVRRFGELVVINAGTLHRDFPQCVAVLDFGCDSFVFHDIRDGVIAARGTPVRAP